MHLLFSLLNVYIFSEVHTQNGRADAIIIHDKQIYCLEFKLDQSADIALEQIKSRGYTERFQDKGFPIHHVGINFSSENKKWMELGLSEVVITKPSPSTFPAAL